MTKILPFLFLALILSGCVSGDVEQKNQSNISPEISRESEVKSKPSVSKEPEKNSESKGIFSRNGYNYDVDVITGATNGIHSGTAYFGEEKESKMYWSGRPENGEVIGDYYHETLEFDGGYLAVLEIVKRGNKLVSVEFDEINPENYYSPEWAGQTKRLSGYASFQAGNSRTDTTLVTIVNAMTFLESQMIKNNSLIGDFYSVKGASNSVRNGYIPLAEKLGKNLENKSNEMYYGLTQKLGKGLFGRLVVIKDKTNNQIKDVRYDEYFADSKNDIPEANLKEYFRQSKYYSRTYSSNSGQNFRELVDALVKDILTQQTLEVKIHDASLERNYSQFSNEMNTLLSQ